VREHLNSNSIASTVRMLRSAFGGSILLVEGEIDVRLFKRFVDTNACHVQLCYNRSNVIGIVSILDTSGFVGHLGVIDRDFADLFNEIFQPGNIVMTDHNDIELMIVQSEAFERFIAEYGSADKIAGLEAETGMPIREIILSSAAQIGALRYLSRFHNWNLRFDEMTIQFAGRRTVDIDLGAQIEHLRGRSYPKTLPLTDAVHEAAREVLSKYPRLSLANGHDFCEIVCTGIHTAFGRANVALGHAGIAVEEVMRAAFSPANFVATNLFAQIRAWEGARPPYRILRV
jgi:hypothetical protein